MEILEHDVFLLFHFLFVEKIDMHVQGLELPEEYIEGFRHVRPLDLLLLDDGFIALGPSCDVVGFDGDHLLQDVGGSVSFERPNFHLSEPLSSVLRFSSERLLGDHRVRSYGSGVDLVLDQVVELHHVFDSDRGHFFERLSGPSVEKLELPISRKSSLLHEISDLIHRQPVQDRSGDLDT